MQFLLAFLDDLWNLKWVTGHRTTIAQVGMTLAGALLAYQGLATDPSLLAAGVNLPDLPAPVLTILGSVAGYLAIKVKKFATEHQA